MEPLKPSSESADIGNLQKLLSSPYTGKSAQEILDKLRALADIQREMYRELEAVRAAEGDVLGSKLGHLAIATTVFIALLVYGKGPVKLWWKR